jgi:heat shock protein HslJ
MKHLLLIPIIVAGCAAPAPKPTPAPTPPIAIEGPTWRLAQIDGAAVADDTLMVFRAGKITGQGPCNAMHGSYERQGATFSIDAILTTKKSCARLDEENRMLDGMLLAQTAHLKGDMLEIGSESGPVLRFELAGN